VATVDIPLLRDSLPQCCATQAQALARRIETAEARSAISAAIARRRCLPHISIEWDWFGSTCTVFAGHWTHLTHAIVTSDDLAPPEVQDVEKFLNARHAIPTIHVCSLFNTATVRQHGFTCIGAADILVAGRNQPAPEFPAAVTRVRKDDCFAKSAWITMISAACLGRELIDSDELEIGGVASHMADTELFTVWFGENAAAGGALFVYKKTGILFCDSTLPEYRGNGFHRDLIAARVQAAWDAGCDIVAATVQRGSASERNYLRCGFRRAYSRLTFQRRTK
jgi:GNAT superfamily N-acetyltransferase